MKMWHAARVFIVFTVMGLLGCGGTEQAVTGDATLGTIARAAEFGTRPPPTGLNGTSPSCFWAAGSQQALRTLGGIGLDQGTGDLPEIPLSQVSQSCRQVLRSAIACALTPDQSVRDPVTGESYSGWWGLSPSWVGGALEPAGRRYVTACMVQRLNYYETSVPILLEGPHPAIARGTSFDSMYPILESTAFGDLFSSTTPLLGVLPAFNAFVCWESTLPQSCGLLGLPLLFEKRICDDAPLCGLIPLGPCSLWCVESGPYWQCRNNLLAPPTWTETVRVRLETTTCQ